MIPFPSMMSPEPSLSTSRISFGEVSAGDFDEVLELRIAAMKESLERVGRFDPQRARERLKDSFHPQHSRFILLDSGRIGFQTLRPTDEGFHLDHLYVHPLCQGLGIGSHVMCLLIRHANERRKPIRVGALRDSGANAFYQRHGFVKHSEEEWDIHYIRTAEA